MRWTPSILTILALAGCSVGPMEGALSSPELATTLVVNPGGELQLPNTGRLQGAMWRVADEHQGLAQVDPAGRLRGLAPGSVRVQASSPRGPLAEVNVAVVASPLPARLVRLPDTVGVTAKFQGPMRITNQADWERVWKEYLTFSPAPPEMPAIDFSRHHLVVMSAILSGERGERSPVITHIQSSGTVHMTFPRMVLATDTPPPTKTAIVQIHEIPTGKEDGIFLGGVQYAVSIPALRTPPPAYNPRAEVYPAVACVGSTVTIVGERFPPGQNLEVFAQIGGKRAGVPVPVERLRLGEDTAGDDGTFALQVLLTEAHWQLAMRNDGDLLLFTVPGDNPHRLQESLFSIMTVCPAGQAPPLR